MVTVAGDAAALAEVATGAGAAAVITVAAGVCTPNYFVQAAASSGLWSDGFENS